MSYTIEQHKQKSQAMLKAIESDWKVRRRFLAPRISDHVWYALGKIQLSAISVIDWFGRRAASSTLKVHAYRAYKKDFIRHRKAVQEAYCSGRTDEARLRFIA